MERIKTAIVGCGMISYIYIKNFQNLFSVILPRAWMIIINAPFIPEIPHGTGTG